VKDLLARAEAELPACAFRLLSLLAGQLEELEARLVNRHGTLTPDWSAPLRVDRSGLRN
jgi:hypothetical protein